MAKKLKRTPNSPSPGPTGSARASVRLKIPDWEDLINFVNGDLVNMPNEDPVRAQMNGILDAIRLAIVKTQNDRTQQRRDNP